MRYNHLKAIKQLICLVLKSEAIRININHNALNITSDILSLKNQLSKTDPNKNVIIKLWDGIKSVADINECVQLVTTITSLIHSFFSPFF
jgi:hypothetical protein